MNEIVLRKVKKSPKTIEYDFVATEGLSGYFSGKPFVIEYPVEITGVPDAVAAIPFVCNVLPIIWLTDSKLIVQELDQAFYECIPNVKKGYETMFPESTFAGEISVDKVVPCDAPVSGKTAAFFSGGLDAVHTLISHLEEKPALISIWGADIKYENEEGWQIVHKGIEEYAQKYSLPDVVIRSSFREFDNEGALHHQFAQQLKDGWWHGVKHGLGLLGHAAPYAYLMGISTTYIASSNCPQNGIVRCASSPLTDNYVRFANTRIVHDGFEFGRQGKVHNVVEHVRRNNDMLSLHVCWESQTGGNCCRCEKCYRTIVGLVAEGALPEEYGFTQTKNTMPLMRDILVGQRKLTQFLANAEWRYIQDAVQKNVVLVKRSPYWKDVKWILDADFLCVETIKAPVEWRERLSKFKFYQLLHKIKQNSKSKKRQ